MSSQVKLRTCIRPASLGFRNCSGISPADPARRLPWLEKCWSVFLRQVHHLWAPAWGVPALLQGQEGRVTVMLRGRRDHKDHQSRRFTPKLQLHRRGESCTICQTHRFRSRVNQGKISHIYTSAHRTFHPQRHLSIRMNTTRPSHSKSSFSSHVQTRPMLPNQVLFNSNYWICFIASNWEALLLFILGLLMVLSRTWLLLRLLLEESRSSRACGTFTRFPGRTGFVLDGNQQRGLCNIRLSSPCLHGEAERQSRMKLSQRKVCSQSSSNKWLKKKKKMKLTLPVCVSLCQRRGESPAGHEWPFQKLIGDSTP